MWFGTVLAGIGVSVTTVTIGLQIYELTGSTFMVGLVGLFSLVPLITLGLYGGSVIDAHDRRQVVVITSCGMLLASFLMALQAWAGLDNLWILYGLVVIQACFGAVNSPARSAIMPRLLPPDLLPAANALSSLAMSVSLTLGPLLAGVLVAFWGFGTTYAVETVMLTIALVTLVALPALPPEGEVRRSGVRSVLEGLAFLRTRPNVRMTFVVDLCAMVLAMPRVLFPAIGAAVIGGGSTTVGVLVAGIAAGSIVAGVFSGPLGGVRRQGAAVLVSVVVWGAAIVVFGAVVALCPGPLPGGGTRWTFLVAAVVALAVAGAADSVSAVFRMTILQVATPDAMRGRLQGVFVVVVAGGPRLGDLLLGSVADLGGEAFAAIAGGLVCVVAVVLLGLTQRGFAHYDARHPAA